MTKDERDLLLALADALGHLAASKAERDLITLLKNRIEARMYEDELVKQRRKAAEVPVVEENPW